MCAFGRGGGGSGEVGGGGGGEIVTKNSLLVEIKMVLIFSPLIML